MRQSQGSAFDACQEHGSEQIGVLVALVGGLSGDARPHATELSPTDAEVLYFDIAEAPPFTTDR